MLNKTTYRNELPAIWLLILVAGVGPLAMNITLPATTFIMQDLLTSYGVTQLVLTLYLLATAVSQIFLGPASDKYGRRPVMIVGFWIFIAGSVICALAPNIEVMLAGRVVQGFGGSVGISLSRVIVRDVHDREKSASLIGYITMAMVVAPMLGPVLGGVLTEVASWRLIFWLSAVSAALLLLAVYKYLHETRTPHVEGEVRPGMMSSFAALSKEPAYIGHVMTISFSSGVYFLFLGGAPYIFTELMEVKPSVMGLYFMSNAIGYAAGNFISGRYAVRFGSTRIISVGLLVMVLGLAILWVFIGVLHPAAMSLPMLLITFSNGLVLPGSTAAALSVRPSLSGSASGISGASQIGIATLLTLIIGFVQNDGQVRLYLLMSLCGLLGAIGFAIAHKFEKS